MLFNIQELLLHLFSDMNLVELVVRNLTQVPDTPHSITILLKLIDKHWFNHPTHYKCMHALQHQYALRHEHDPMEICKSEYSNSNDMCER